MRNVDKNRDFQGASLHIANAGIFSIPDEKQERRETYVSPFLTIRVRVPYSQIFKFSQTLDQPIDSSAVAIQAKAFAKRAYKSNLEELGYKKEDDSKKRESIARNARDIAMSETRVHIYELTKHGTKKDNAAKIAEHFNIPFSVAMLDKVISLSKPVYKKEKNAVGEMVFSKDAKGKKIKVKEHQLSGRAVTSIREKPIELSAARVSLLWKLFNQLYQLFFFFFVPAHDSAELLTDEKGKNTVVLFNEQGTGKFTPKERKVKMQFPVAFAPRSIESHFGKVYPTESNGKHSPFIHRGQIAVLDKWRETKEGERIYNGQVMLPISLAYISPISYEYVKREGNPLTGEKGYTERVPVLSEIREAIQPIAYEEREEIETVYVEEMRKYETHRDKIGKVKYHKKGKGIVVDNAGLFVGGELVSFLNSLFNRYRLQIPEDKTVFLNKEGKVFRSINRHVARFGMFDVINSACVMLWSEMLAREANKKKQFTQETFKERAIDCLSHVFNTYLRESRKIDSTYIAINTTELENAREGYAEQFATQETIERAHVSLHEIGMDEETLDLDRVLSSPMVVDEEMREAMRIKARKQYIDKKYTAGMVTRSFLDEMKERIAADMMREETERGTRGKVAKARDIESMEGITN